jgi:hypothetical protein
MGIFKLTAFNHGTQQLASVFCHKTELMQFSKEKRNGRSACTQGTEFSQLTNFWAVY